MTLKELIDNANYSAAVVRVPEPYSVDGLDNLHAYGVFGSQILSAKDGGVKPGDLAVYFPAECRLSLEYAAYNNLHRKPELNADPTEVGYLEQSRRVRAIRLRKHRSDAMLMPLESLMVFGADPLDFQEGDTFDHVNGQEVCRKHVVQAPPVSKAERKVAKAFRRVDAKMLPEHYSTDNYFRSQHLVRDDDEVVVTIKAHGTSVRVAHTIIRDKLGWRDRIAKKLGVRVSESHYGHVAGSRKVIKDPESMTQDHFYGFDLWTREAERVRGLLPMGYALYGELIGWASEDTRIQANYDYGIERGTCDLLVYRIAHVSPDGTIADLSWDQTVEFCRLRGLKTVPEIWRGKHKDFVAEDFMEQRFAETLMPEWYKLPKKLVDEGVVLRKDGIVPTLLKIKNPTFLRWETGQLDKGEVDLESA